MTAIRTEQKVDNIASAFDNGRQGGFYHVAFDHNIAANVWTAAFPQQDCPISVHDYEAVAEADNCTIINVKCGEL